MSELSILAWVGEDENGSGQVGIKRVVADGEYRILAATSDQPQGEAFLDRADVTAVLQQQANVYGKRLMLVRFTGAEIVKTIKPRKP